MDRGTEEGEDAHRLAEKMTTEPAIILTAACIFVLLAAISEWESIVDAIIRLFK